MDQMIGRTIDNFQLENLLGVGGMGTVYLATDTNLNRKVAIKMTHPHLAANSTFQRRFVQEAQAIAQLKHPHIASILQFSPNPNNLYLVMEYIEGGSLRQYLELLGADQHQTSLIEIVELIRQLAEALYYAHQQGMIHRDIKPENVLLRPTPQTAGSQTFQAVLTDFGLVKLASGLLQSDSGYPVGTWPYMSPEQCLDEAVDTRSDIFALGIMLFELVTGQRPFQPQSWPEAFRLYTKESIPTLQSLRPDVLPELDAVCQQCVARDPNDRFQTAHDLARALQKLQAKLARQGISTPSSAPENHISVAEYLTQVEPPMTIQPQHVDQLVIRCKDEEPRIIMLDEAVLTIGRSLQNDLVLKTIDIGVSRQHARLERRPDGRYHIIDLHSVNGTRIDSRKLEPDTEYVWPLGAAVYIGDYQLYIEPVGEDDATAFYEGSPLVTQPPIPTPIEVEHLQVTLEPANIDVEPGQWAEIQIKLANGRLADEATITVDGLPAEWATIAQPVIRLMPNDTQTIALTLNPPRLPTTEATKHTFQVRVKSMASGQAENVVGNLHVTPFYEFTPEIFLRRLVDRDNTVLDVINHGNTAEDYQVEVRTAPSEVQTYISENPLRVEPGATGSAKLRFAWETTPGVTSNPISFEVRVSSLNSAPQTVSGDIQHLPLPVSSKDELKSPPVTPQFQYEPEPITLVPDPPVEKVMPPPPVPVVDNPNKVQTYSRNQYMSQIFNFYDDELQRNRAGNLSDRQRNLLRQGDFWQGLWSLISLVTYSFSILSGIYYILMIVTDDYYSYDLRGYYIGAAVGGIIALWLGFSALRTLWSILFSFPPRVHVVSGRMVYKSPRKVKIGNKKMVVRRAVLSQALIPADGELYRAYYAVRPRYRWWFFVFNLPVGKRILLSVETGDSPSPKIR